MKSIYGKRKNYTMPSYLATPEEEAAYKYCVRNNIRISPKGIQNDPDHWKIEIRMGPYKRGERANEAPSIYCRKTVWPEFYRMCKYYYDKRKK
jgi:hypothetical protein